MSAYILFLWLTISSWLWILSGESCTKGFMDYDLLVQKAEQIGGNGKGDLDKKKLKDNKVSIMPSLEFNCSGTITGFLLGVYVRTEGGDRVEYPTIWLWSKTGQTTYTRVADSSVKIILGPSNFSTDGVYQFSLSTPLQFTANQVLGIYQPKGGDSVVRFYYQDYNGQDIYETDEDDVDNGDIKNNRRPLIHPETHSPQCISGFISSDEIKIQARKITKVKEYDNDERFFPDIGFTCNGNITHIIIGAKNHNKDKLPQIRFWRLLDGGEYEQTGSSYPLVYNDANDPSTTNLRWYNLSQPIQVQNRNVLGISQPNKGKSDLILYYQENSGPPNYESNENMDDENNYPLVSIIFAMSSSTPFSFSISESNTLSSTAESASSIISFITSETTGSPSTSKSSSSTITSTSETTSSTTSFTSEKNSTTSFTSETTSSTTSFTSETTSSTTSFTSETASSTTRFTSETTSSTTSFTSETTSSSTSFTSETPSSTIIFTSETTSSPVRITGDSRSSTISSTSENEMSSTTMLRRDTSSSTSTVTSSPTELLAKADPKEEDLTGVISGVVVAVIVILLLILIVGVLIFITMRKKRKGSVNLLLDINSTGQSNPVYQSDTLVKGKPGLDIPLTNPVYGAQVSNGYETVGLNKEVIHTPCIIYEEPGKTANNAQSDFYSEAGMTIHTITNAMYGMNSQPSTNSNYEVIVESNPYNTLQWGICVPTTAQRQQIESHYEMQENIYGHLQDMQYSSLEKSDEDSFFTEEKIYWTPSEDTSVLYEQLAQKKYREILRHQIQITGHLGSGQFGTVDKGVWNSPSGPRNVAIKTLKGSAAEEEKVKFLQEAAINGQFHHPNVVKLYGVVTVGEPTMIVLELVSHGDLRGYLQKMRPVPGELVDTTVPNHLLSFCRQIASGMEYLSKKHFIHRDLAARNILVADNGICKIADFGMSRDLQDENYYISHAKKIPIKWTSPEALNFKKYSTSSDVWSFGAVLYEIWSLGHKPFEEKSNQQSICLVESGYRLPPPPGCPRPVYEMMIQCWHPETSSRPTFDSLVSDLSQPDFKLLQTETDTCLGAQLDTAHNLYPELQNIYI